MHVTAFNISKITNLKLQARVLQWEFNVHPPDNLQILSSHPLGRISWCHAYHSWPAARPDETKKKQQANWSRRLMRLRPAGFLLFKVTHTAQKYFFLFTCTQHIVMSPKVP